MSVAPYLLFWGSVALIGWVYAGYPVAAWAFGRLRPFVPRHGGSQPKLVTIAIAAHNEGAAIEERIRDTLAQATSFPIEIIIGSDGSTDATDRIVSALTEEDPRIRLLSLERGGQTLTQSRIFAAARGEVVVLTDAETRFTPGCLESLVAPFADPRVGCVTGRLQWLDEDRTATAHNEGLYWRYEQVVRRLESRAGWLTAVTGALLAIRRDLYHAVPAHASMDHVLPLYVRERGHVVLAEPAAVATDRGIAGLRQQFRNRARTATRGIQANLWMAGRLAPWRRPSAALAIWSHKLLRWATPWLLMLGALGAAWAVSSGAPIYLVPLAAGIGVVLMGLAGFVARHRGARARWAAFPLAALVVNVAFLVGWLNLLRGRRIHAWRREDWRADRPRPEPGRSSGL